MSRNPAARRPIDQPTWDTRGPGDEVSMCRDDVRAPIPMRLAGAKANSAAGTESKAVSKSTVLGPIITTS